MARKGGDTWEVTRTVQSLRGAQVSSSSGTSTSAGRPVSTWCAA
ncbi:hypothetical protein ACN28S_51720 [Cystobacter fuscus]